jgi:hypothetical protein
MKPVTFKNRMNSDKVICEDTRKVETIDGVEYLVVHKQDNKRPFLMRKDALERVKEKIK